MFGKNVSNKFLNRMFRRIPNLVWDMSNGQIGIRNEHGIHTLTQTAPAAGATGRAAEVLFGISVNPFESMAFPAPAYGIQTKHEDVETGDLLIGDKGPLGWVTGKTEAAFKVLDISGQHKTISPPKVAILGGEGILVVKSLFGMVGGESGFANLQGNLLPLLMASEGESDLDDILPLMLFSQSTGSGTSLQAMQPLLMMKLLGSKLGGNSGGIKDLILMQAMTGGAFGSGGGAGAINPMLMMALLQGGPEEGAGGIPALQAVGKLARR
jgi:hypothetical protein